MKLEIQNLTAEYETGVVLQDFSLSVREGEFLSLLGPSGCGKTTLMKSIAGILTPKSGRIFLDGQDITNLPIHRRGTTVVFQDMRLFPHKSVAENVAFPLKMQGISKAERLRCAEALLEKVRLDGFENRKPSELSGGQQQRVALARALAAQPRLLLLDEPFSALDENLREDMRNLVLQLKEEFQMTVILVTHDREEALSMSDRVALMFGGQLAQMGTPREVYTRPVSRQAADYFGDCVYIPGKIENNQFSAAGICCFSPGSDGDCTLLRRPGDLHLEKNGDYILTVESLAFRGSDTLLTLRAADGTIWKKAVAETAAWQTGETLRARLDLNDPIFFS